MAREIEIEAEAGELPEMEVKSNGAEKKYRMDKSGKLIYEADDEE